MLLATDFGVARRLAPHVVDRRGPAHDLLDGRGHELGVAPQQRELVRVVDQRAHAAGERVLGGVVAGGEGDQVVAEGLERTHRLAVDLAVREHGGEIVARVLAAVLDDRAEELEELEADLADRLLAVGARALQLLVLAGEELVGEAQDARLLRRASTPSTDERMRSGCAAATSRREVALALAGLARELVDDLARRRDPPRRRCGRARAA